ncbi:hypothetical protein [Brevundimonas sp. NIBR11]|uniref:hypothetical protein n=1 Tax=Brevundimonas sp. NIBR11 TaxID=3015999 RepID=UPI0022F13E9B|nr:hypothetical protein [Brevundimonas sp. NIBR11]WGM30223.1 hypothetical protein KKHFBJBL_00439 [Brevundimonas sp. NIBR11]
MTLGLFARTARVVAAAVMIAATPMAAFADGTGTYYDRTFVLAAHQKCNLFRAPVAGALSAAALQSRGAALRAGTPETTLQATAARAQARARQISCANPELAVVRDRVSDAFAGWQRIPRMDFNGDRSKWTADRVRREAATWRLVQTSVTGASPVRFGLSATAPGTGNVFGGEMLTAVVSFVGRPRPYAARIVMRDPALAARPWMTPSGRAVLPPETGRQTVWSAGTAPAPASLLATGRTQGETWTFPTTGGDRLSRLDPREPFLIEFLFRDGSVATATFEAGDFAAGRAFVAMGTV